MEAAFAKSCRKVPVELNNKAFEYGFSKANFKDKKTDQSHEWGKMDTFEKVQQVW